MGLNEIGTHFASATFGTAFVKIGPADEPDWEAFERNEVRNVPLLTNLSSVDS